MYVPYRRQARQVGIDGISACRLLYLAAVHPVAHLSAIWAAWTVPFVEMPGRALKDADAYTKASV